MGRAQQPVTGTAPILLSKNVRISTDSDRRNGLAPNTLVFGGVGSGKSQGFVIPNIMQKNTSYVVVDPSGECYRSVGRLLEDDGYVVKCFDLVKMDKHRFNPFIYIAEEADVRRLATSFAESTTDATKTGGDQFWTDGMQQICEALISFIWECVAPQERSFSTMLTLIRLSALESDDMGTKSTLDHIFEDYAKEHPDSYAVCQWDLFKTGAPKTRASIITTLATRLGVFGIQKLTELTCEDELELDKLGDRKQTLFCCIPEGEKSFDFLVGLLYTTLFSVLYRKADDREDGFVGLNVPVQIFMDEWANCGLPDNFEAKLATARKRRIMMHIIVQGLSQLKRRLPKSYEEVYANCPLFLYLGNNEPASWKFISETCGKETINVKTTGKSGSNFSSNQQVIGSQLLTEAQVRRKDRGDCIVLIQGEKVVIEEKYDVTNHKDFAHTLRGGSPPFKQEIVHIPHDEMDEIRALNEAVEFDNLTWAEAEDVLEEM